MPHLLSGRVCIEIVVSTAGEKRIDFSANSFAPAYSLTIFNPLCEYHRKEQVGGDILISINSSEKEIANASIRIHMQKV
ncbi:MAG: hypothetical protein KAS94_14710 [Desulfobulbaceae bacterium]|nr:hypothetical protein [Desulfobulbaceae bacterium]